MSSTRRRRSMPQQRSQALLIHSKPMTSSPTVRTPLNAAREAVYFLSVLCRPSPLLHATADGPNAMWTGYTTSRAALKGYVRETSNVFTAARQLQAFTGGAPDMTPTNPLYHLERSLGVAQHHDSVAGENLRPWTCVSSSPPLLHCVHSVLLPLSLH